MRLFFSPIEFFRARIGKQPDWPVALTVLACTIAGTAVVALVTVHRGRAALEPTLAAAGVNANITGNVVDLIVVVAAVMGLVASFSLMTGAVVLLDSLFSQSGRTNRLVEFSALAHVVQLPWILIAIALTVWGAVPEVRPPAGVLQATELRQVSEQYLAEYRDSPAQNLARLLSTYTTVWIVALQACALHVVSGFSARGAWAAGCTLALVFGIGPWAWQMFR